MGLADEGLAPGEGEVDVGAAAELGRTSTGSSSFSLRSTTALSNTTEHDHFGAVGGEAGEDGAEDAGVNDAGGHAVVERRLWSTQTMMSRREERLRPKPMRVSGMMVLYWAW